MSKRKYLTACEQVLINEKRKNGLTIRQIAEEIQRSKSAVGRFLKGEENPKIPKKRGRKSIISDRVKRGIIKYVTKNRTHSLSTVSLNLHLTVSRSTIRNVLMKLKAKYVRMKRKPFWKPSHIIHRLDFARQHQTWSTAWRNVIFSDEKRFNLDGPDCYKHYWHFLGEKFQYYSKRQCGGGGVTVWGAFAYGGFLPLQEVMGNLNAMKYQLLLQRVNLSEWGDVYGGSDFLFMQDNAPPHAVSIVPY